MSRCGNAVADWREILAAHSLAFSRPASALHGVTAACPQRNTKMLSQQLHDLEGCGMIHREVIPEKPPKTVYSLTAFGESIIPVIDAMCQWGTNYMDGRDVQSPCCNAGA